MGLLLYVLKSDFCIDFMATDGGSDDVARKTIFLGQKHPSIREENPKPEPPAML